MENGGFNTLVGTGNGRFITTGSSNVVIGSQSACGNGIGIGTSNITIGGIGAIGATTGQCSGSENIAIGRLSGNRLTSGSNNALYGFQAGTNITTGNNNCMIGELTGTNITTESGITILGATANCSVGLSNATAIGFGTLATASNSIFIGRTGDATVVGGNLTYPGTSKLIASGTLTASGVGTPRTLNTSRGNVTFTGIADIAAGASSTLVINNSLVTISTVGGVSLITTTAAATSSPRIETTTFGGGTISIVIRNSGAVGTGISTYTFAFCLYN